MKLPVTKQHLDAVIRATNKTTDMEDKKVLIDLAEKIQVISQLNEREEQALALTRGMESKEITSVHTTLMDRLLALGILANATADVRMFNADEIMRAVEGMQILIREIEEVEAMEDEDTYFTTYTTTSTQPECSPECSECNIPDDCSECDDPSDPCCRITADLRVERKVTPLTAEDRDVLEAMRENMKEFVKSSPPALFSLIHLNHKLDALLDGAITRDAFSGDDIALISAMFNDILANVVETEPVAEDRFEMRADVLRIRSKLGELLGTVL